MCAGEKLGRLWICDGRELGRVTRLQAFAKNPLIMALFEDWRKGRLRPEIEKEIEKAPPHFVRLRELICYKRCPEWRTCTLRDWDHNPIVDSLCRYYDLWLTRDRYVRRTLLMLTILSQNGIWSTGYRKEDLKKLAGVKKEEAIERIINELNNLGFLKKVKRKTTCKATRYYIFDYQNLKAYKRGRDEYWRGYARMLVEDGNKALQGRNFRWREEFNLMPAGILIGPQPPDWFISALKRFEDMLGMLFRESWSRQFINAEYELESVEKRSDIPRTRLGRRTTFQDSDWKESLRKSLHESLDQLFDDHYSLTLREVLEWLDFSTKIQPKKMQSSLYVLSVDEVDHYRKKEPYPDREQRMEYVEWNRRREVPTF